MNRKIRYGFFMLIWRLIRNLIHISTKNISVLQKGVRIHARNTIENELNAVIATKNRIRIMLHSYAERIVILYFVLQN
jgi:hypothetical protein